MNKRALRADVLLLVTACIWGFGFVAQRSGMEYVGPFTFNAIRFILGSLSLIPLILYRRRKRRWIILEAIVSPTGEAEQIRPRARPETALAAFLVAGTCLFVAVSLQQLGIMFTTVGNAGFITGLYVVFTPIFGMVLGKKTGIPTWIGAVFTLAGLYFISVAGHWGAFNPGDMITVISAVFWACHVLLVDNLVQKVDPIVLSSGQFAWCGVLFFGAVFALEPFVASWARVIAPAHELQGWQSFPQLVAALEGPLKLGDLWNGAVPILYGGLASVGIAYTLQVVAQRDAPPAHATIILCLEGLFAALGGMVILGEKAGVFTLAGFVLMLLGMLITQWDVVARRGKA